MKNNLKLMKKYINFLAVRLPIIMFFSLFGNVIGQYVTVIRNLKILVGCCFFFLQMLNFVITSFTRSTIVAIIRAELF